MVQPPKPKRGQRVELPGIQVPGGADSGSKWLIAAVLAAGKDGCECDACKLLKRFGGALSEAMLKDGGDSGD